MAITAREYRLPPEDCDDLTRYASEVEKLRAERDALAARVERLTGALENIADARETPSHGDPGVIREFARAALAETQGEGTPATYRIDVPVTAYRDGEE